MNTSMRFIAGHHGTWLQHIYYGDVNLFLCKSQFYSSSTKSGIAACNSGDSSLHWPIHTCVINAVVTSSKWKRYSGFSYCLDLKQQKEWEWLLSLQQNLLTLESQGSGKEIHFKYHPNKRSVYTGKYMLLSSFDEIYISLSGLKIWIGTKANFL